MKTELEVFSEQRYKDTAVVVYRQLKGKEVDSVPDVRKGWVDNEDPSSTIIKRTPDDLTLKDRTIGELPRTEQSQYPSTSVQAKVCTVS